MGEAEEIERRRGGCCSGVARGVCPDSPSACPRGWASGGGEACGGMGLLPTAAACMAMRYCAARSESIVLMPLLGAWDASCCHLNDRGGGPAAPPAAAAAAIAAMYCAATLASPPPPGAC